MSTETDRDCEVAVNARQGTVKSPGIQLDADPWLERHRDALAARAGRTVLELGCGAGRDTGTLVAAGFRVVALDRADAAIARARAAVPSAEFHCQDMRDPWPASAHGVAIVVASLSLHYFAWDETCALVERIASALAPRGLLLCRLNSTNDVNYGAHGHPRIAENFYLVDDRPKRFFDRPTIDALFARGWNLCSVEERVVHRYAHPKVLWDIVAESPAQEGT